jgi:glycosyltransferase involved in cell wall biosynthesis
MTFVGLRAARAAGVPVVHTEHGSDYVVTDSAVIRAASRLVDRTVGRWVLRHADRVLGVSEAVTAFVARLAGVDAEVFYNAIDAPEHAPSEHPQDTQRTVFVGRLVPGKGWDDYLDALAALHASGTDIAGDLVGDGPDMSQVRARVRDLGIGHLVTIHGRLPQSSVRELLRGATLVNPTLLAEGFQTTLLESVAEGGRIVTYAVPGAQTLQAGGAPVLITPAKDVGALTAAMRAELGKSWARAPAELIDAWTWPARARQFVDVCSTLDRPASEPRG